MIFYLCLKKTPSGGGVRVIVSNKDIKARIETILSDILSKKHEAKITIKFVNSKEKKVNGNDSASGNIGKE